MDERFERAIQAIDAANADDPNTIEVRGVVGPKELAHAELMTEWVRRLRPSPPEALLLAARAHHLRRWVVPRSEYPEGRAGYLRWRRDLHRRHAEDIGRILADVDYDAVTIERVQALVAKRDQPARDVSDDPDMRAMEDALCLVFIETQLRAVADQLADDDKTVDVIRKTLRKMSDDGIAAALGLPLADDDRALIERAAAG
ncbi:MAG: DUF4202 domain-containing protein [Acidimicrobiales bacterium]